MTRFLQGLVNVRREEVAPILATAPFARRSTSSRPTGLPVARAKRRGS